MAKPIINKITPFDANKDFLVTFSWLGNRTYSNRIIVSKADTQAVVFDDTVSSFALQHTIPGFTLQNGNIYTIQVQVFDEETIPSPLSDKLNFYVFETPEFYFENIPADHKVTNASFNADVHYYSSDWESINTYTFSLYDSTKKLLLKSEPQYDEIDINYSYRGLENDTNYYIRCVGTTVNGMYVDTGYINIYVKYENPNAYARIYTTNLPKRGCIHASTNLVIIQYNGEDDFEYENGMIKLIDKTLYYDEGFFIENDMSVIIRGIHMWHTNDIFKMSNGQTGLTLSSHIYANNKLRFKLTVPNGVNTYLLYSDELVFEDWDLVSIFIQKKNDAYKIRAFIKANVFDDGDLWLGSVRPMRDLGKLDTWIDTEDITFKILNDELILFSQEEEPNAQKNNLWIGGE